MVLTVWLSMRPVVGWGGAPASIRTSSRVRSVVERSLSRAGSFASAARVFTRPAALFCVAVALLATPALAGEADLEIPDLKEAKFFNGSISGHDLLLYGSFVIAGTLGISLFLRRQIRALPAHASMLNVADVIFETCKTYLTTQGRFILILWAFIAVIIAAYFGWLSPVPGKPVVLMWME